MPLVITTKSATSKAEYQANYPDSIYPAFLDNLPYWSFINSVNLETGWNQQGFQLKATGATGSNGYTWELTGGALPDGLSMNSQGLIYGKPTKYGIFTFTVRVSSPGQTPVSKTISMIADKWRAEFMRNARTYITAPFYKGTYPNPIRNTLNPNNTVNTHIPEWMSKLDGSYYGPSVPIFDPVDDAAFLEELGFDIEETAGKPQSHCVPWISTVSTRYSDHASRNILLEQVNAYHAVNKRVFAYFAADSYYYGPPPQILCDGGDVFGNFKSSNLGHVRELCTWLNVDGIVYDIGATSEHPAVNEGWLGRSQVIALMRNLNPWLIFGMSAGTRDSGIRMSGSLIAYPHCDFVIYENVATDSTSDSTLEIATPPACEKKMAVHMWYMIGNAWSFSDDSMTMPLKDIDGLLKSMTRNVNVGASVAMGMPVRDTGFRRIPYFMPHMTAIGNHHKSTKNFSDDVEFDFTDGLLTMKTAHPAEIYYTTDGTEPTTKSKLYFQPIPVTKNTRFRARSLQYGKSIGYMSYFNANPLLVRATPKTLFVSTPNDTEGVDAAEPYKGMIFTVGQYPILLKGVGRKIMGVSGMTTDHPWIIRRRWDEYPIVWDKILVSDYERNGYKIGRGCDVRLEAGMTYVIAIKEGAIDKFAANNFQSIPINSDIRIEGVYNLSKFGEFFPAIQNGIGQFINLDYEVLTREKSKNVAIGAIGTALLNNSDNLATINGTVKFAQNAFNGEREISYASVGGTPVWTLRGDMIEPKVFNRAEIYFRGVGPSSFDILVSQNGKFANTRLITSVTGNSAQSLSVPLGNTVARFVHLRSITGGMAVHSLELYND